MHWVSGVFQQLEEELVRRLRKGTEDMVNKQESVLFWKLRN